jgi:prepilin-type processing-associated H-X9-DG protein
MVGNAGEFMQGYSNTNNPGYRQYLRLGDIRTPSGIFTFIDEHPDSINDGYFLNRVEYREWMDLPASYHGGAASLSYADGHGERHRWRYPHTRAPALPDAAQLPIEFPAGESADFDWLINRTTMANAVPANRIRAGCPVLRSRLHRQHVGPFPAPAGRGQRLTGRRVGIRRDVADQARGATKRNTGAEAPTVEADHGHAFAAPAQQSPPIGGRRAREATVRSPPAPGGRP